jgi:hypothetical protein
LLGFVGGLYDPSIIEAAERTERDAREALAAAKVS